MKSLAERQAWLRTQPGIGLSAFQRKVLRDAQEAATQARQAPPLHPDTLYDVRYREAAAKRSAKMARKQRNQAERTDQELERRRALMDEMTE